MLLQSKTSGKIFIAFILLILRYVKFLSNLLVRSKTCGRRQQLHGLMSVRGRLFDNAGVGYFPGKERQTYCEYVDQNRLNCSK